MQAQFVQVQGYACQILVLDADADASNKGRREELLETTKLGPLHEDIFGTYRVITNYIDPKGRWCCTHEYHSPGDKKKKKKKKNGRHWVHPDGIYYSKNPDGSQQYIQPMLKQFLYVPPRKGLVDLSDQIDWKQVCEIPDACILSTSETKGDLQLLLDGIKARAEVTLARERYEKEKSNKQTEDSLAEDQPTKVITERRSEVTKKTGTKRATLLSKGGPENEENEAMSQIQTSTRQMPKGKPKAKEYVRGCWVEIHTKSQRTNTPDKAREAVNKPVDEPPISIEAPDSGGNEMLGAETVGQEEPEEGPGVDYEEECSPDIPEETPVDLTLHNESTTKPAETGEATTKSSRKRKAKEMKMPTMENSLEMQTAQQQQKKRNKKSKNKNKGKKNSEANQQKEIEGNHQISITPRMQTPTGLISDDAPIKNPSGQKEVKKNGQRPKQTKAKTSEEQTPIVVRLPSNDNLTDVSAEFGTCKPTNAAKDMATSQKRKARDIDHDQAQTTSASATKKVNTGANGEVPSEGQRQEMEQEIYRGKKTNQQKNQRKRKNRRRAVNATMS
ncbi:Dimeric alpha-beta barrel [Penicillium paradoxum]|uniref:Dimeric alpha-beta barrel n=1 Tax=Penicillium paradoxum TaxID=176176 RepID=UPI002548985C|nr:Dimeric alpha-beta barrel [Penicillium paradoxum]KAJ5794272.1 Dimeric alpha-beta barrel [Penicillium paradoxum]